MLLPHMTAGSPVIEPMRVQRVRASACRVASGTLDRNVSTSAAVGTVFGAAATRRTIPTIDQGARTDTARRLHLLAADVRGNQTGPLVVTRLCDPPLSSSSVSSLLAAALDSRAPTRLRPHRTHRPRPSTARLAAPDISPSANLPRHRPQMTRRTLRKRAPTMTGAKALRHP